MSWTWVDDNDFLAEQQLTEVIPWILPGGNPCGLKSPGKPVTEPLLNPDRISPPTIAALGRCAVLETDVSAGHDRHSL
jgi:hypothetical protein